SAFALLPAQNASGNWIKIVQRVPVRIALDQQELTAHPLRVGLSMKAQIDLHDTSGSLIANEVRTEPQTVISNEEFNDSANQQINRIITANAGGATGHGAP
ncbi:MAG: EmrA/EmrK family multidrug efflux transporter periplasmic adaptor subunit, partial [Povalibacter sp.]